MDANTLNNAAPVCPNCNKPVKPGAKFCNGCGTKLNQAPAASAFAPVEDTTPANNAFAPVEEAAPANNAFAPAEEKMPEATTVFDPYADEAPASFAPVEEAAPASFAPVEEAAPAAFGAMGEAKAETQAFAPAEEKPASAAFSTIEAPKKANDNAPAFGSVEAKPEKEAKVVVEEKYEEPESVFAQGLPEWSIEPPLTAVKRRRH